jgi:hypothetical protein
MSKEFACLLSRRFAPLKFSTIPSFPHPVPFMDIWGDYIPWFREEKEDNPSNHLIRFHQCMAQLHIHDEDVLMKMFFYSLEGDEREWYLSLTLSSISSLKEFHRAFHEHCKRYFSQEIMFEYCCEEFHLDIQHIVSSGREDESGYINGDTYMDEVQVLFITTSLEEDLPNNIDDFIIEDDLYEPVDSNLDEKDDNDKERGDVVSDLFQGHTIDNSM